jgi:hypothetical protein
MTNKEAINRFSQCHGAEIEKLFWIAGSLENSDFKEVIEEMDDDDFKKCFPEIENTDVYREDDELTQALADNDYFGLLAVVHIPEASRFSYNEKGAPQGWSVSYGICRIHYAYAESLEALMAKIEEVAEIQFQKDVAKDKKKKAAA